MVLLLYMSSLILSRVVIQFYILCKFNYPWYYQLHCDVTTQNPSTVYISIIIILVMVNLSFFFLFSIGIVWWAGIGSGYIIYLPLFWILVIQSAIAYKYHQCFSILSSQSKVTRIFDIYKQVYKDFKSDYPLILNVSIQWQVLPVLFFLWSAAYDVVYPTAAIEWLFWSCIFLMIVPIISVIFISGCFLNEKLDEFHKLLWDRYENEQDQEELNLYSRLIQYINHHPIEFKLAGLRITKKNTILFILGFIASRLATNLVAYLVY